MTATHDAAAAPRNRLPLLVGGGIGLGLLLFLAARVLGGGGGEQVKAVARPSAAAAATATTATTAAPAAPEGPAAIETFEVFTTKNPFIALRTSVVASTASATAAPVAAPVPAATVASASGTVAATPAVVTSPAPAAAATRATTAAQPAAPAQAAAPAQVTEPVRSTRVALLDVFAEGDRIVANVRVNDTVSKVGAGDTFASNFKVVSLDSAERCGRFLFGDDQFRLCKGEEVLK